MRQLTPVPVPDEASSPVAQGAVAVRSRLHLPALDGVRGLAILLILVFHLMASNEHTGSKFFDALNALRATAWVGVDLFFVLSGFLITGILFDSVFNKDYFKNFYVRRMLRIFPLYYGLIVILLCLTYPLHLHWDGMQYLLLTYTQNIGQFNRNYTLQMTPAPYLNLNHFWSLAVEEQFYLAWPFIVFLLRDARKLILTGLLLSLGALALRIVLMAQGAPEFEVYTLIACRADSLMIGGMVALLLRTPARDKVLHYSGPVFLAGLVAIVGAAVYLRGFRFFNHFVNTAGYSMLAITFAGLIGITVSRHAWTRLAFENGFMRFFGKYSYGIYVFHYSLDAGLTTPLRRWLGATVHSKAIVVVMAAIAVGSLSVLVAVLSFQLYEKHFLKLKKYFEPRAS